MPNCCPQCNSKAFKKNGYTRHGKQNHRCLDCGKQFSMEPELYIPCVEQIKNTFQVGLQHMEVAT